MAEKKDSFLDKLEKLPSKLLNFILEPMRESQRKMMEEAGFSRIKYYNILSGIVTIHVGFRL